MQITKDQAQRKVAEANRALLEAEQEKLKAETELEIEFQVMMDLVRMSDMDIFTKASLPAMMGVFQVSTLPDKTQDKAMKAQLVFISRKLDEERALTNDPTNQLTSVTEAITNA
jgi:hypothetical protein